MVTRVEAELSPGEHYLEVENVTEALTRPNYNDCCHQEIRLRVEATLP